MGTVNNPGQHNCLAKAIQNPDMPIFLLLASDPDAPAVVEYWAQLRMNRPDLKFKAAEAINVAHAMRQWKVNHASPLVDETAGGWSIAPLFHGKTGAFLAGAAFMLAVFTLRVVLV